MSKIIGLTGGIASGKSYASDYFKKLGFSIIDCDKISNNLYLSLEYQEKIIKLFGNNILENNVFSKRKLSNLVFSDKTKLEKLNEIAFPIILDIIKEKIENYVNEDIIFIDAPILVESKLFKYIDFDKILMIETTRDLQIERLKTRNNLSEKEALNRINTQLTNYEKFKILNENINLVKSISIITNVCSLEYFEEQLSLYIKEIKSNSIKKSLKNEKEINMINKKEKIVVYAGSFDPITYGHIDIIKKAARDFNKVIVGILVNEEKEPMLSFLVRKHMIEDVIKQENLNNVQVKYFNGLLVNFMKNVNSNILIRGLRTSEDFIYEQRNYLVNKDLNHNIETHYFMSNPEYIHVSSSLVRTLLKQNFEKKYECISKYVPNYLIDYLK